MLLILLEALGAGLILVAIVWWTMFSGRSEAEHEEGVTKNEALPWKERDHALFAGFAPVDAPRYAIAVIVEHGGSGAHVAVPIARDILVECQTRMKS